MSMSSSSGFGSSAWDSAPSVGDIAFQTIATETPWELGLDAIVVSVGETLGSLGEALRRQFPELRWDSFPLYPEIHSAQAFSFPGVPGRLSVIVLASPHERSDYRSVTIGSVVRATDVAVVAAAHAGATSIGLPLLGTGRLRLPPDQIAARVVPAVVSQAESLNGSNVRRIVFFDRDENVAEVIRAELQSAISTTPSTGIGDGGLVVESTPDRLPPEGEPEQAQAAPLELAAGHSVDLVDPSLPLSLDRDCLGMRPYVCMLATLIASQDTQEPLSVGVFGDWGSGKSYFMAMLRGEINRLSGLDDDRYYQQIRSIGFNAWTYADANLWASLGDEVFRQLLATPTGSVDAQRPDQIAEQANLQAKLAGELEQRKLLETAARQAKAEAAALQGEVSRATAEKSARVSDVVAAVLHAPTVRERARDFVLGVDRQAVAREALLAQELAGTAAETRILVRATRARNGAQAAATTAVLATIVLLVALFSPSFKPALYSVFATLGAIAAAATLIAQRTRATLRLFGRVTDEVRAGLVAREQTAVKAAVTALHDAQARQQVSEAQLAEVVIRIGELGRQLVELTPGARLYSMLSERVSSDTYGKNLGLISMVRRDFSELVGLLQAHRTSPRPGLAHRLPTVDRIVLYIDDLDRCTPRRVVEVLEAVHLLLAIPLFVVVIGVDPRWLLRALNSHYSDILTANTGTAMMRPEDYLEKIINVPVILPAMTRTSMHNLVQELRTEQDRRSGNGRQGSGPIPEPREAAAKPLSTFDEFDLVESASEVAAQQDDGQPLPPPRTLTDQEAALLGALGDLIDSPRDAKRLMNIYRMIRATRDLSDAAAFLGDAQRPGEYQAVAVLLGLTTFDARLAAEVFDARVGADGVRGGLLARDPDSPWPWFVADLQPVRAGSDWRNGVVGTIDTEQVAQWTRVHRGLADASAEVGLADLTAFQAWIPKVRRFSFIMSGSL